MTVASHPLPLAVVALLVRRVVVALVSLAFGCSALEPGLVAQRIIEGTAAPDRTGVVHVSHPAADFLCSGVVVHPRLVLTARHCVFRAGAEGPDPLDAGGFSVGFGAATDVLVVRAVVEVARTGDDNDWSVESAVADGTDVAALVLAEAVPSGTFVHPVAWGYVPQAAHELTLVGYGLSSTESGASGEKLESVESPTAFGSSTGIIETTGNGACRGDSGGPMLFGDDDAVVAVVSEVGGSDDETFCDVGLSYGASVANGTVEDFLRAQLSRLPECPHEVCDNGQDEDCDGVADDGCEGSGEGGSDAGGGGGGRGPGGADPSGGSAEGGETGGDESPRPTPIGTPPEDGSDEPASASTGSGRAAETGCSIVPGASAEGSGLISVAFALLGMLAAHGRRRSTRVG